MATNLSYVKTSGRHLGTLLEIGSALSAALSARAAFQRVLEVLEGHHEVLWGTVTGSMLPIILRKMKLDPATISAPFVATLVDVTGLVIYFGTAIVLLKNTLLKQ